MAIQYLEDTVPSANFSFKVRSPLLPTSRGTYLLCPAVPAQGYGSSEQDELRLRRQRHSLPPSRNFLNFWRRWGACA